MSVIPIRSLLFALSIGACGAHASAQPRDESRESVPRNPTSTSQPASPATAIARQIDRAGPPIGPGTIGPFEPIGPEIDSGVYPPLDFTISGYTTNEVGLRWWYKGGPQTRVFRQSSGGPWTVIQTLGVLTPESYIDFRDIAATPNAENCYRVSVSDGVNAFTAKPSPIRCAMTRDGRAMPVRRLQLRLHTATAANADTEDAVEVRLQSPSWLVPTVTNWRPAGNNTWIDSTFDDFERGTDRTYELMRANISEMSDITQITLAKPGGDKLCVARIELLVTGQSAFSRSYGQDANNCAWVGGDELLSIKFEELRSAPSWNQVGDITPAGMPAADLRAIIMAQFGHFLHGKGELRNGSTLTTTFKDARRIAVNVPIRVYDVPILGNVDSNVHFDLVMTPGSSGTKLSVENVDANSSDLLVFFMPIVGSKILWETSQTIESAVNGIRPTSLGGAPAGLEPCFKADASIGVCITS